MRGRRGAKMQYNAVNSIVTTFMWILRGPKIGGTKKRRGLAMGLALLGNGGNFKTKP